MLPPEKHTFDTIWGHDAARTLVPRLLSRGRLPHAILLTGPPAIGKRSLAFAMAKALLSAGRPTETVSLNHPASPAAKRPVPPEEPGEPGDDLFAGEADLFETEQEDLFGEALGAEEKEEAPQEQKEALPPAQPPPLKQPSRRRVPTTIAARYTGLDERIARLVEASYPPEPDKNGRPTRVGHVDLSIVEPSGGRRGIVVDQIRYLQSIASLAPVEGAFRVVLVFGADTITQEGGNSILKLLEEPPSYLIMILVADRLSRVLPTIKSRCSVVPMAPLERDTLVQKLVEVEKLDPELAKVAAALSECRPGIALSVLEKSLLERRREVFEARLQIDRFGPPAIPASTARMNAKSNLEEVLWLLLSFARDRMVRSLAPEHSELLVHEDALDLLDWVPGDPVLLDEEADRLVESFAMLAHPFVPTPRVPLQLALWPS